MIVASLKPKQGIRISHGTVHHDLNAKQKEIQSHFKDYIEKELTVLHGDNDNEIDHDAVWQSLRSKQPPWWWSP